MHAGRYGQMHRFLVFLSGCTAIDEVSFHLTSRIGPDRDEKALQPHFNDVFLLLYHRGHASCHRGSCERNIMFIQIAPVWHQPHMHIGFAVTILISNGNTMQVCFIALFVMNCLHSVPVTAWDSYFEGSVTAGI